MSKKNNTQLIDATVSYIIPGDDKTINLYVDTLDGDSGVVTLVVKRLNVSTSELEVNDEMVNKINAELAKSGLKLDDTLTGDALMGQTIKVYKNDEGQISLFPFLEFERTDTITPGVSKDLDGAKFKDSKFGLKIVKVRDIKDFGAVNLIMSATIDDSEVKLKVSQLVEPGATKDDDDRTIKLKYLNKNVESMRKSIEKGEIPSNMVDSIKKSIDNQLEVLRIRKYEELSRLFGISLDEFKELLEEDDAELTSSKITPKMNKLKSHKFSAEGKTIYYLSAELNK